MDVKISLNNKKLSGVVNAPISKSEAHRLLICAALSDNPTKLFLGSGELSEDIYATINCLRSLGAGINFTSENTLTVAPIKNISECPELDCKESGSTLRFMLPVAAALCERVKFTGCGRLPERPVKELINVLKNHGVNFSSEHLPFEVSGKLQAGTFEISGSVSSQYISGLMLALPILKENSTIKLTSALKSSAYVDITISALKKFGVDIEASNNTYKISGSQKFLSQEIISVCGDWSSAAFFLAAGALGGPVSVSGLNLNSPQGDKKVLDVLKNFGADVKIFDDVITVSQSEKSQSQHFEIDIDPTPDLLPILAISAACSGHEVNFFNASRLRLKESDRITATASLIRSLGGEAVEKPDALFINGRKKLLGGVAHGFHDHRIVMAAAVAGVKCPREVIITDAESTRKSYPEFFRDYKSLGGRVNVI